MTTNGKAIAAPAQAIPRPVTADERRRKTLLPPLTDGEVADYRRLYDAERDALRACAAVRDAAKAAGVRYESSEHWQQAWREAMRCQAVRRQMRDLLAAPLEMRRRRAASSIDEADAAHISAVSRLGAAALSLAD